MKAIFNKIQNAKTWLTTPALMGKVGVAILLTASMASCQDMLAPESELYSYEDEHKLNTANDTVFSVMGVVHLMQQVADRSYLLGEVRGDLVNVTEAANADLKALADFTATTDNAYNQPQDYYAIVNNCNYFIEHADSTYKKRGQKVFERELAAMRTFRAWAYLQLAINHGEIPFYTQFIGTEVAAAEVLKQPKKNITEVCNALIDDLTPCANVLPLTYNISDDWDMSTFFISTRLMLGELCLWAGRYQEAATWYHDFLNDGNNPVLPYTSYTGASWYTDEKPAKSYRSTISTIDDLYLIPMEKTAFDGTISQLENLYNSTEDNYFYNELTYSQGLIDLSARQRYYYVYTDEISLLPDTICMSDTIAKYPENDYYSSKFVKGDLRVALQVRESWTSGYDNRYNTSYQTILKIDLMSGYVTLYRRQTVYLHYAEALNRAGYPSAAFAILKYGLCKDNIDKGYVDSRDVEAAGNLITFNQVYFTPTYCQGIHSRGCGDVEANPEYVIPMPDVALGSYADTVAFQQPLVEDLIIEESALEQAFEGQRYFDLIRIAKRRNNPAYLADRIALRNGKEAPNEALRSLLMQEKNWYLPLKN